MVELQNTGPLTHMALSSLVAFASGLLGKPAQGQMVVLGDMSLGGSITPVASIAECLQVAFDAGGKRVALPMTSAVDLPTIRGMRVAHGKHADVLLGHLPPPERLRPNPIALLYG